MKQREVTDKDGTQWTCVQAYEGLKGSASEKATELSETEDGKVPVVCTPSGGAKSVRLQLNTNWFDEMSDGELAKAIAAVM